MRSWNDNYDPATPNHVDDYADYEKQPVRPMSRVSADRRWRYTNYSSSKKYKFLEHVATIIYPKAFNDFLRDTNNLDTPTLHRTLKNAGAYNDSLFNKYSVLGKRSSIRSNEKVQPSDDKVPMLLEPYSSDFEVESSLETLEDSISDSENKGIKQMRFPISVEYSDTSIIIYSQMPFRDYEAWTHGSLQGNLYNENGCSIFSPAILEDSENLSNVSVLSFDLFGNYIVLKIHNQKIILQEIMQRFPEFYHKLANAETVYFSIKDFVPLTETIYGSDPVQRKKVKNICDVCRCRNCKHHLSCLYRPYCQLENYVSQCNEYEPKI